MFNIHKNNSGTTYADVQDAVYKEIDDMPLELMSKRFELFKRIESNINDYLLLIKYAY